MENIFYFSIVMVLSQLFAHNVQLIKWADFEVQWISGNYKW